jgi:uncharacterized protein YjdB
VTPPESTDKKVTAIAVTPSTQSITIGGTTQLRATITPADATNQNVKWSSKQEAVASVSESGVVTGKTAGVAHIVASAQDGSKVTGEAQVTVAAPTLGTLTVDATLGADGYSVTVTPNVEAGNTRYYRVTESNAAPTITYDQTVTTSEWTAFTSGQKITSTDGENISVPVISVVELTAGGKARKYGKATLPAPSV